MGAPTFCCPDTGLQIEPGIDLAETAQAGAESIRFVALHVRCPHCGEHHEIKIEGEAIDEAA